MSAPEAMTYDSLMSDIEAYAERSDSAFVTQVPRFIMLAENRIASEVRSLGLVRIVNGVLPINNPTMAKPMRWRETKTFSYINSLGKVVYLKERRYDYCRSFWPSPAQVAAPRYYADYDFEHFFLAATPDAAYQFELAYHERPDPLSATVQTNWTTRYAPQLLLYASLLEAQPFLKNSERIAEFQSLFSMAKAAIQGEEAMRDDPNKAVSEGAR